MGHWIMVQGRMAEGGDTLVYKVGDEELVWVIRNVRINPFLELLFLSTSLLFFFSFLIS